MTGCSSSCFGGDEDPGVVEDGLRLFQRVSVPRNGQCAVVGTAESRWGKYLEIGNELSSGEGVIVVAGMRGY